MQGDQIGRFFAAWVIVFFGQFFVNYRLSPNFWGYFFHGKNCALILTKNGLGFGRFFHKFIWSP
jgi:hypothetical protein